MTVRPICPRTTPSESFFRERKDSLGVVLGQVGLAVIVKISGSVTVGPIGYLITSLRRLNAFVMPLAEMSADILRVGFFQGLGNGDLTEVFLLRFHGRQNGISQATGRHPMEEAIPGGSAQSGR